MNAGWILADVSPNSPAVPPPVTGEPVNKDTTSTAIVSGPNTITTAPQPKPKLDWSFFLMIGVMVVLLYFMMFRGPRKRQQQQRTMIETMKKNDRVQTIGGILGTVIEVKPDEVTIKIDESNNTKIRVIPSAISRVLTDEKS